MNLLVAPRSLPIKLLILATVLLTLNIIGIVLKLNFDASSYGPLIRAVDFDTERNLPTLFSTSILLFTSGLLLFISKLNKNQGSQYLAWLSLSIIFLFLGIDEFVQLHERFNKPAQAIFNTSSGFFNYAWVIPYIIGLPIIGLFYIKFLASQPRNIMFLFIGSGCIFIMGAIGFEMLGANQVGKHGASARLIYSAFYTVEEFLEMCGVILFIYSLLLYISIKFKDIYLKIEKT